MGVTIHYSGQLRDPPNLGATIAFAEKLAKEAHWGFERIESVDGRLPAGFVAYPHQDCEPLRFEFGFDLKVRSWVKTQFAGAEVHVAVIRFLKQIQPVIGRFGVRDEGEYWETENRDKLNEHIDTINRLIEEIREGKPGVRVKIHEPDGRIIDVIG